MVRYYDLVLVLIPVALLGFGGALLLAGVGREVAVSLSGLTAVALIGHAIFVNGPVTPTAEREETAPEPRNVGPSPYDAD